MFLVADMLDACAAYSAEQLLDMVFISLLYYFLSSRCLFVLGSWLYVVNFQNQKDNNTLPVWFISAIHHPNSGNFKLHVCLSTKREMFTMTIGVD